MQLIFEKREDGDCLNTNLTHGQIARCHCGRLKCIVCNTHIVRNEDLITTGELFDTTGYYAYTKHADNEPHPECFITKQSNRLLFQKGETAPALGSCNHLVMWQLLKRYN